MVAFLDTHAALFLAEGRGAIFGRGSTRLLERAPLQISPFVRLELALLREIGRINSDPDSVLGILAVNHGVAQASDDTSEVVAAAMHLSWCRDPFDRLLVATAILHAAPFVTRDAKIQAHYPRAVW